MWVRMLCACNKRAHLATPARLGVEGGDGALKRGEEQLRNALSTVRPAMLRGEAPPLAWLVAADAARGLQVALRMASVSADTLSPSGCMPQAANGIGVAVLFFSMPASLSCALLARLSSLS